MPSRVMHVVIAADIAQALSVRDLGSLLLGAVAPDGSFHKPRSHVKGPRFKASAGAPFEVGRFVARHPPSIDQAYLLGYVTHLMADALWAQVLYFSGVKRDLLGTPEGYARLYRDYAVLNHVLGSRHPFAEWRGALAAAPAPPDLPELTAVEAERARQETLQDMTGEEGAGQTLRVLSLELVDAYCERAAVAVVDASRGWWR